MKMIVKKTLAVLLAAVILFGAGQSLSLGISASASGAEGTLSIETKFFREENEQWLETERVAKGEQLKARAYIGTDYYTNSGELMFFYDSDFFTDDYERDAINKGTVNPVYADLYGLEAQVVVCSSGSRIVQRLLDYELVTQEFIDTHVCVAVLYSFAINTPNLILDESEWLIEFDLTAISETQTEIGDFFALESTVQSTSNPYGYISVPWGKAGEFAEDTIILADKDVYVEITGNPVASVSNIVFDTNGGYFGYGEYGDRYEASGNIGEDFYLYDIPPVEKEGCIFMGWADYSYSPEPMDVVASFGYEDMRYYAVWEYMDCEVHFHTMCEYEVEPLIANYGMEIHLPELTREGYTFEGWIDENGSRVESPFVLTEPQKHLTAVWVTNKHEVIFDAKGGTFDGGSEIIQFEYAYGDAIGFPKEPTREGYVFAGWVNDNGESVDTSALMPDMSMVINAVWEPLDFTVTYETYTEEYIPPVTYRFGDFVELPDYVVKDGYYFAGWSVNGEIIYGEFYMPAQDVVISAEWVAADNIPYTVEVYVEDYGFGEYVLDLDNTRDYYGTTDTEIYIEDYPEITGFTFEPAISVTSAVIRPDGSTVLMLYYTRNNYPLVLYSEGAELLTQDHPYDFEISEPEYPEREGYRCVGWMFRETGAKADFPIVMPADIVELEAIWEAEEYTVEFNTDGGEEIDPVTVAYGEEFVLPSAVKTGCIFVGWRDADNNMYTAGQTLTVPAHDVKLRAVWMIQSRRVTFVIGNDSVSFDVVAGQAIPMPDMSQYENIEVICWLDENGKKTEIPDAMPDNNLKFTAKLRYSCGGNDYGVTASYESGCFEHEGNDLRFVVEKVTGNREPGGVYFKGVNYKQIALYNIKFYYGNVQIQPENGKVEIRIPVPAAYKNSTSFIVVHRFSGGGYEEIGATANNGMLVFSTGSFSEFEIYVKAETVIKTKPAKLSYNYKDALDLSGLTLETVDANGNKTVISDTSKMTVKGYDPKKIGTQTLTVEYDGTSAQFNVTVSYAWWQMLIRILLLGFLWY